MKKRPLYFNKKLSLTLLNSFITQATNETNTPHRDINKPNVDGPPPVEVRIIAIQNNDIDIPKSDKCIR